MTVVLILLLWQLLRRYAFAVNLAAALAVFMSCILMMHPVNALEEESEDLDYLLDYLETPSSESKADVSGTPEKEEETRPQEAVTRAKPSRRVLEEIVVTAQKREEDIQSVPLSVTAIGGDDIVDKNMGDMNEVANYVPNLDVLAVPTFPSIYMRGLGSSYNRGFEQSVAILIDEVFYGRASYINQGLLDLHAIEVLRGPQGTLFGKNSSAGAIHFRTAGPGEEFAGNGDLTRGDLDLQRLRLIGTGPLGQDFGWRAAFLDEKRDGSVINTTTGLDEENRDNQSARLRLTWDPTQDFGLDLTLNSSEVDQHGAGSQLIRARARHLAAMQVFDPRTADDPFDGETAQDHLGFVSRQAEDVTAKADWELGNGLVITSISNVARLDEDVSFDADFSPVPFLILDNNEDLKQISQELRVTSPPGQLEYVAGLYYLKTDLDATYDITDLLELSEILLITGEGERRACVNLPDPESCQDAVLDNAAAGQLAGQIIQARQNAEGGPVPVESSLTRFGQITESAALFGQATWHFTERWSITLGGRLNDEDKSLNVVHRLVNHRTGGDGNAVTSGGIPGTLLGLFPLPGVGGFSLGSDPDGSLIFPIIIAGDTQFSAKRQRKDTTFIPKLSVQHDFADDAMAYLTVAQGYKSGGYNAQPVNDEQLEFDEEEALTYEIGVKSEWLGGAARVNVSAFHTDFDGLQVATFNGVSYVVGNAASAKITGIEYEGMLLTSPGFLLGLNGAYTDAEYESFPLAPCGAERTDPPPCDLSGRRLRLVPEHKATLTAGWEGGFFNWPLIASAGLTASYTSDVALATDLDPIDTRIPGTTYGVQLGVRSSNDRWHVRLFGDNVTSRESLAGAQDAPAYRGTHFGGVFPEALYELEVGFRF